MDITPEDVTTRLTNQAPRTEAVGKVLDQLTAAGIRYGHAIARAVPPGREKSLAVTALEETQMWAKKGVALHQGQVATPSPVTEAQPPDGQWWVINGQAILDALGQVARGAEPADAYAQLLSTSERSTPGA